MNPRLKLALQWLLNAVALMLLPEIITDLQVESYTSALVTALLLGLINALIRPWRSEGRFARFLQRMVVPRNEETVGYGTLPRSRSRSASSATASKTPETG